MAGLVDQNGVWIEVYAYDAYGAAQLYDGLGEPLIESAIGNPYFFTGRRLEVLSNMSLPRAYRQLYHCRARAYDPLHGRFLERDLADYVDGMNLHEYVRSVPISSTDPFGYQGFPHVPRPGRFGFGVLPRSAGDLDRDLKERARRPRRFDATGSPMSTGLYFGGYYRSGDRIKLPNGTILVMSANLWPFSKNSNLAKAQCVLREMEFPLPAPENGVYWAELPRGLDGYTISFVGAFWNYVAASFVNHHYDRPTRRTRRDLVFRGLMVTLYHELKGHNQDRQSHSAAFDARYETPIKNAWDTLRKKKLQRPGVCCQLAPNRGKLIGNELNDRA